jgi:hypothetical protein
MEDIFKFHQANVPFLIFPHIKSLIGSSCKSFVTKQQKIETFKVKITGLQSPDAFNHLPKHLQVQFNKLIKADLSPEILKVGHDFLFQKEVADLRSKISLIETEIVTLEKEYLLKLDQYLAFAQFTSRPSESEAWDAFCVLYYNPFITHLKAHFLMGFDKVRSVHDKRKALKQKKFAEFKHKRSQPIIITEEVLEQKFKQFSISNSKKVRFTLPKTGKRSAGKDRAPGKSHQGGPQRARRSPSPRGRSPSPKKRTQSKSPKRGKSPVRQGRRSSRKGRS